MKFGAPDSSRGSSGLGSSRSNLVDAHWFAYAFCTTLLLTSTSEVTPNKCSTIAGSRTGHLHLKGLVNMATRSRNLMPLLPFPLNRCPQCLHIQYNVSRHFSSTPSAKAMRVAQPNKKTMLDGMKSRKSRRVEMKNMSPSKIPDDVGIIQQTFIRPPNRDLPRLFSDKWKSRLKLELLWARTRAQNFGSYVPCPIPSNRTKTPPSPFPPHFSC